MEVSEEEEQLLQGIMVFSKSSGFVPCRTTGDSLPSPCVFCWGEAWLIFLHFSTTWPPLFAPWSLLGQTNIFY